jgi:bacteriorhodopsin
MRRFTRLIVLTAAAVFVAAAPAGAAPLLANEKYKWFYWAAPILAVAFFLMVVRLGVVYVRRVILPRQRGRRVE